MTGINRERASPWPAYATWPRTRARTLMLTEREDGREGGRERREGENGWGWDGVEERVEAVCVIGIRSVIASSACLMLQSLVGGTS